MIHGARARGLNACSNTAPMQILPEQPPIGTPGTTLRRNEAYPKKSKMKRILICFCLTIAMLCRREFALGFDQQRIENSRPSTPVRQFQITFEDLASANSFTDLRKNELAMIVPLVTDGGVATVVGLAKDERGWKIASLGDKSLSSDLDTIRRATGPQVDIVIYDLPHSGEKVYAAMHAATGGGGTTLYTNYPGFNLRDAVPLERLLPLLKQDAAEFQRKYGEELKRQRVVR